VQVATSSRDAFWQDTRASAEGDRTLFFLEGGVVLAAVWTMT
jgi:hypothetical protein